MSKKKEKKGDGITYENFNGDQPEFYKWWKKHRHSGFVEDHEGKSHWNTLPAEAWYCDRYRVEFSIDTGSPYRGYEYSAEEIEKWAREQKEMEDYVQGDYRCLDVQNFLGALNRASRMLARKFSVRKEMAEHGREFAEAEIQHQVNVVDRREKANESPKAA